MHGTPRIIGKGCDCSIEKTHDGDVMNGEWEQPYCGTWVCFGDVTKDGHHNASNNGCKHNGTCTAQQTCDCVGPYFGDLCQHDRTTWLNVGAIIGICAASAIVVAVVVCCVRRHCCKSTGRHNNRD